MEVENAPLFGLLALSFAAIPSTLSPEAPCEEGGLDEKRRSPEEIGVFEMRGFRDYSSTVIVTTFEATGGL